MPGFEPPYYVENNNKIPINVSKENFDSDLDNLLRI